MATPEKYVFPDDVKDIINAFTTHIRSMTRYWILAVSVTSIIIFATIDSSTTTTLDMGFIKIPTAFIFHAGLLLIATANIGYTVSHIQLTRISEVFRKRVAGEPNIGTLYLLIPSSMDRIYPLAKTFHSEKYKFFRPKGAWENFVRWSLKVPLDAMMITVPLVGVYLSWQGVFMHATGIGLIDWVFFVFAGWLSFGTAFASITLCRHILLWTWGD